MSKEGRWQAVRVTLEGAEGPEGVVTGAPSWMTGPEVPGSVLHMGLRPKTWRTDSSFPRGCSLAYDL